MIEQVEDTVTDSFDKRTWHVTETVMSSHMTLCIDGLKSCFGLIIVGQSGTGKTTALDAFEGLHGQFYRTDEVTPASFVSHDSSKTEEELRQDDLLPKINHQTVLNPEMANWFSGDCETRSEKWSTLIRVMDGRGYTRNSGTQGERGYTGNYRFKFVGATTPLDERVADAFAEDDGDEPHNKQPEDDSDSEWTLDDDVRTNGGTTVGFFDVSHPQPRDNSQRLYTVTEPTITRPLVKIDTPAAGFYALNGESVLQFPPNQDTEEICACFEEIREQNPGQGILLVLDNFSSHVCAHTRERAHELGIDLVFLPIGSPHFNPIEPIWKSLKWESSPLIVEGAVEYRVLLDEIFTKLTEQLSFVSSWIENHLNEFIQKLR